MIFNKPKSSTLAAQITALDEEIATAAAADADLKSRWRVTIVAGDDAARSVIEEEITAAERKAVMQAERRNILTAEHEAALDREAREEFGRRYAAQKAANEKAVASAQKALRRAWDILVPVLRELAEARAATDLLNKARLDGFASLPYADDIARGAAALPRVDISETIVGHWCFKSTGNRIADQDAVQGNQLPGGPSAPSSACEKRRFRHVRYHPAEDARFALPIATEIRFPRWDGSGVIFDGSVVIPESVTTALDAAEANLSRKTGRPIREEFIAIDDTASGAA